MTTTVFVNGVTLTDADWFNDTDRVVYDADGGDHVNFTPVGTGGSVRSLQAKGREIVSLTDYGGVADSGGTDNGPAFQKAHDALGSDGGSILIPAAAGYYGVSTQAAFTKDVELIGAGVKCSEIGSSTAALVWFTHTARFVVRHVGFTALGAAISSCVFVKTLAAASNHGDSGIYECLMSGAAKCYWGERTNKIHVERNSISGDYGLYLQNLTSSDEGDSFVSENTISCTTAGILVLSTAGLYLANNKFNGACPVHIDVAPDDGNVGNFTIVGGSLEGHTTAGIRLLSASDTITKTLISGVQFSSASATHLIFGNQATNTNVTGCTFNDTNASNGVGIDIQNGAQNTTIVGNSFHQILTAIKSSANVTGQTIKGNRYASNVTNMYLGGENDQNQNGPGSEKEFDLDAQITNTSNTDYVNAFKWQGRCVAEVFITGTVQGSSEGNKYRKVICTNGPTVTDIIAVVSPIGTFDLQVVASGSDVVVGIKRNGATGTSVTMQVGVKLTGYPLNVAKV